MINKKPLQGIQVLELSPRLSVSACGFLLSELGAEVTVIGAQQTAFTVSQSLSQAEERIRHLGKTFVDLPPTDAHEFMKGFRVIIFSEDDFGDEKNTQISQYLPHLLGDQILCSITDQGLGTQQFSGNSSDLFIQALSGLMAVSGLPAGRPEFLKIPISEMCAAVISTLSIVAAIYSNTKKFIDLSQLEIMADQLRVHISLLSNDRPNDFRQGCGHPLCSPWDAYPAIDGWVIICASSDAHWHSLLKLMNAEHLLTDSRFVNVTVRRQYKEAVDAIVTTWTSTFTVQEIFTLLRQIGLPCGPASTPQSVPLDIDLLEAGTIQFDNDLPYARTPIQILQRGSEQMKSSKNLLRQGELPLEGVKVVEFTAYAAGPMAGYLLAALGAEVIKIEPPKGEEGRKFKPQYGGVSGYFINYNAGKQSIEIDLQDPINKSKVDDLIKSADIVLHNMRPGAMEKLGFGIDQLLELNPHLIYCSISGYGLSGPKLAALDTVIQGHLGLTGLFGHGDSPIRVGYSIADQLSGHFAAVGMVAALLNRRQINHGQVVDIAMSDSIGWLTQLSWNQPSESLSSFQLEAADGWVVVQKNYPNYPKELNRKQLVNFLSTKGIEAVPVLEVNEVIQQESLVQRGFLYQIATQNDEFADLISPPLGTDVYEPKTLFALGTHNYLLDTLI